MCLDFRNFIHKTIVIIPDEDNLKTVSLSSHSYEIIHLLVTVVR